MFVSNNKKWCVIFALFLQMLFCACSMKDRRPTKMLENPPRMAPLIQHNGMPTKALSRLLELTSILPVNNQQQLIEATQQQYLRPPNKERWQISPINFGEEQDEILALLKKLGFIEVVHAPSTSYQGALVLGANIGAMRERIAFLIAQWQRGIRFPAIICLTGNRPRFLEQESASILFNKHNGILPFKEDFVPPTLLPKNEREIMQLIFSQSEMPPDFSSIPVIFVDAQKDSHSDPSNQRITTLDTVDAWIKNFQPQPGNYLVVSSQPYVTYQDAVVHSAVPEQIQLTSVGPGETYSPLTIQMALDALARALYQNYQRHLRSHTAS